MHRWGCIPDTNPVCYGCKRIFIAAAAIVLSAQTILSTGYAGYVQGIAPIVSYHFGAENDTEMKALYRVALKTIAVMSVTTFAVAFPLANPIARLFASGFFTALNDGRISAILSLFRTLMQVCVAFLRNL